MVGCPIALILIRAGFPMRDAYGVTNIVVAGVDGSAPLAHPVKFHAQLTPIPVTMQQRMMPLNFVDAAYRAAMFKSRFDPCSTPYSYKLLSNG